MNNLGDLYERGGYGIQEDDAKAVEWFEKAAATGNRTAMCNLSEHYDTLSIFHPSRENSDKAKQWNDKCHEVENGAAMH